ncbi:MAG: putative glycoside hydrolase [bacterium]
MIKKIFLIAAVWIGLLASVYRANAYEGLEGRAVWAYPSDAGQTQESVIQFVDQIDRAHINLIVMLVKGSGGDIYWQSEQFSECVNDYWKAFDGFRVLVEEAHKRRIRVHAWLCDFTEGKNSPAFRLHPEWAMRNEDGGTTDTERIQEGRSYNTVWMCPSRRPGYTDQWLLPMIVELARLYDVDGIHHDYVRYPGDVSPDGYCFCDWCLEDILKHSHLYYEAYPDRQFSPDPVLPRPEANWWLDYAGRPEKWESWTRKEKVKYLKDGKSWKHSREDMDYFWTTHRTDAINRFVREAWEEARKVRPDIEMSAAVFKNPAVSGRAIGQRWTDFAPWVDIMMPMTYRSHFPGDFETFLTLLGEYVRYQNAWSRGLCHTYIGITGHYIYKEEYEPVQEMSKSLGMILQEKDGREKHLKSIRKNFDEVARCLASLEPETERSMRGLVQTLGAKDDKDTERSRIEELKTRVDRLLSDPPEGFYPGEKLVRTIQTIRDAGGEGIVLFAATHLTRKKLWPAVEKVFAQRSVDPDIARPMDGASIQSARMNK